MRYMGVWKTKLANSSFRTAPNVKLMEEETQDPARDSWALVLNLER